MRKTITITITADGRDKGKAFLLHEMAASRAEKWAARAFLALSKSGVDIPDDIASAGLAGVAAMGFKLFGGMTFADAEVLLDEMFYSCIAIIPDPSRPTIIRGAPPPGMNAAAPLVEDDIEEVATRLRLRKEVLALHVDFSKVASLWTSAPAASEAASAPST